MPPHTATAGSLPEASGMVKAMRADGPDWGTGYLRAGRRAPAGIIRGGMAEDVDRRLGSPEGRVGGPPVPPLPARRPAHHCGAGAGAGKPPSA